jgi:hypothetical protein
MSINISRFSADPQRDQYFRDEATKAYQAIFKWFRLSPIHKEKDYSYADLILPRELKQKYPELKIKIRNDFGHWGFTSSEMELDLGIKKIFNDSHDGDSVDPTENEHIQKHFIRQRDAFIHEFIHFLDYSRAPHRLNPTYEFKNDLGSQKYFTKEDIEEFGKYFTDPFEINANYQQFIFNIEQEFNGNILHSPLHKEIKQEKLLYYLTNNDFNGFYDYLEKQIPDVIARFMFSPSKNPKKFKLVERKFRSRLYKQFQHWRAQKNKKIAYRIARKYFLGMREEQ